MNNLIFEGLFYMLTSLMGFLILIVFFSSRKSHKPFNLFFSLIILFICVRLSVIGTFQLNARYLTADFRQLLNGILLFNVVLIYLYFKSSESETKVFYKKDLFHLIAPAVFLIYSAFTDKFNLEKDFIVRTVNFILLSFYSIYYFYNSFRFLKKTFWKSDNQLESEFNKVASYWIIFLVSVEFLSVIRLIASFSFINYSDSLVSVKIFFVFHTFIWMVIFIKISISKEMYNGFPKLNKKNILEINENLRFHSIWKIQNDAILNYQDAKMTDKMKSRILNLIKEIECKSYSEHYFRNHNIAITDLAREMGVPVSHLNYLFKYHCKLTFTEFKTLTKIEDAKQLIKDGFLTQNTLESLASEVGFFSYNPFFAAFKKIECMSPNEYATSCLMTKS